MRQQEPTISNHGHDDRRRHAGMVDQAAGRAELGALLHVIRGGRAAAAAEAVIAVPVHQLPGPAGRPDQSLIHPAEQLPQAFHLISVAGTHLLGQPDGITVRPVPGAEEVQPTGDLRAMRPPPPKGECRDAPDRVLPATGCPGRQMPESSGPAVYSVEIRELMPLVHASY